MEEADVLADRIAIMHSGVLKCVDNSISLKNRLSGYLIKFKVQDSSRDYIIRRALVPILGYFEHTESIEGDISSISFRTKDSESLENVLKSLQKESNLVTDLTISQTSLEDVFLSFDQ